MPRFLSSFPTFNQNLTLLLHLNPSSPLHWYSQPSHCLRCELIQSFAFKPVFVPSVLQISLFVQCRASFGKIRPAFGRSSSKIINITKPCLCFVERSRAKLSKKRVNFISIFFCPHVPRIFYVVVDVVNHHTASRGLYSSSNFQEVQMIFRGDQSTIKHK